MFKHWGSFPPKSSSSEMNTAEIKKTTPSSENKYGYK